ncbi:hypothetical protein Esti_000289 [Eimeria stiedai]
MRARPSWQGGSKRGPQRTDSSSSNSNSSSNSSGNSNSSSSSKPSRFPRDSSDDVAFGPPGLINFPPHSAPVQTAAAAHQQHQQQQQKLQQQQQDSSIFCVATAPRFLGVLSMSSGTHASSLQASGGPLKGTPPCVGAPCLSPSSRRSLCSAALRERGSLVDLPRPLSPPHVAEVGGALVFGGPLAVVVACARRLLGRTRAPPTSLPRCCRAQRPSSLSCLSLQLEDTGRAAAAAEETLNVQALLSTATVAFWGPVVLFFWLSGLTIPAATHLQRLQRPPWGRAMGRFRGLEPLRQRERGPSAVLRSERGAPAPQLQRRQQTTGQAIGPMSRVVGGVLEIRGLSLAGAQLLLHTCIHGLCGRLRGAIAALFGGFRPGVDGSL